MKNKLQILATLTQMRAQLLSAMLEEQGIESFMTHENSIKEAAGGVDVMVKDADFKKSLEILDDFKSAYGQRKQKAIDYMRIARRILIPVDFSEHSENAAIYAIQIAAALKADIMLLNAYLDPGSNPFVQIETFTFSTNLEHFKKEMEMNAKENLKRLSDKIKKIIKEKKIKGVNVFYDLVMGSVYTELPEYAAQYKPGLVIMGTRGDKKEGKWSFGSVTAKMIDNLKCPVLAVPAKFVNKAAIPEKILYATNFDDADYWAMSKLASFAKPFKAKIFCLHISEIIETPQEVQMHKMKEFITDTLGEKNLECGLLECIDLQMCLEDFSRENNIDIIALTKHHRSLLERLYHPSITKDILYHSEIPMLIFHSLSGSKNKI